MEFKIYDILSSLIHGVICLGTAMQLFGWSFQDYGAMYFAALSFCIGYLINTIGSWLQKPLFWSFGGMPTKQLLRKQKGKTYAGISSIPFYFSEELVDALKKDLQVDSIIDDKFSELMQQVARQGENIRIKDFNCSYAFSRSMLISSLIISALLIYNSPCIWQTYLILIIPIICYCRCKNRAFHYAKEVAMEYLHTRRTQETDNN